MLDIWSIALLDNSGSRVACCNIESLDRAADERNQGDAPRSSAPSGGLGAAEDK